MAEWFSASSTAGWDYHCDHPSGRCKMLSGSFGKFDLRIEVGRSPWRSPSTGALPSHRTFFRSQSHGHTLLLSLYLCQKGSVNLRTGGKNKRERAENTSYDWMKKLRPGNLHKRPPFEMILWDAANRVMFSFYHTPRDARHKGGSVRMNDSKSSTTASNSRRCPAYTSPAQ